MDKLAFFYMVLLFVVYQIMFKITGFSVNTAVYGLFAVLIFFYYSTDNLQFNKKSKQNPIFVNIIIFMIFLFFYKNISIFTVFLVFSVWQMILYRIFKKLSYGKNNRYTPKFFNERNIIKFLIDSLSVVAGIIIAFMLKFSFKWNEFLEIEYIITYLGIFLVGYVYKSMSEKSWSYTNILDVLNILILNTGTAIVFTGFMYINEVHRFPITTLMMTLILSVSMQLLGRYAFRLKRYYGRPHKNVKEIKRTLIYGAGEAGAILARESMTNPYFPYELVGFIDDDEKKIGSEIYNIKVLGNKDSLEMIIKNEKIEEVLLALPSIHSLDIRRIVERIQKLDGVKIKTVPSISEILENESLASQIRDVRIEDLLGRDEIVINDGSIRGLIEGKVIFVTGGAGSIGSELTRQIAKFNPKKLITLAFSDCCFIIFKQKYKNKDIFEESVIKEILISFSKVCVELLKEKIFFRGGIAYGDVWNDMEGMFGPAANEAYLLESKFSKYVRIGINKEIAELVYKDTDTIVLYDEKEKLYYLNIFYLTEQGKLYVNENKCGEYLENIHAHVKEVMKQYKKKMRDIIENKENIPLESISLLEKYGHILQKYLWFNNYLQERKKYKKI